MQVGSAHVCLCRARDTLRASLRPVQLRRHMIHIGALCRRHRGLIMRTAASPAHIPSIQGGHVVHTFFKPVVASTIISTKLI